MSSITLPKILVKEINMAVKETGLSRDDLLASAILYYLKSMRDSIELSKELKIWEQTSDADLLKFEKAV